MIYWVGFIYLFNRLPVLTDSCFWDLAHTFHFVSDFPLKSKSYYRVCKQVTAPLPFLRDRRLYPRCPSFFFFFCFPAAFFHSISKTFYTVPRPHHQQSIREHHPTHQLPFNHRIKKISSNQPQPFKSWWNKPKLNPFAFFRFVTSRDRLQTFVT